MRRSTVSIFIRDLKIPEFQRGIKLRSHLQVRAIIPMENISVKNLSIVQQISAKDVNTETAALESFFSAAAAKPAKPANTKHGSRYESSRMEENPE